MIDEYDMTKYNMYGGIVLVCGVGCSDFLDVQPKDNSRRSNYSRREAGSTWR